MFDNNDIQFRQATVDDAESMDALNRQCLPENYSINDWRHILTIIPQYSFVAFDNDKLVGYILGTIHIGFLKNEAFVASIAVDAEYRSRGIAEKLIKLSIDNIFSLSICTNVKLNVRLSNYKAQNLYEKLGFQKTKLVQQYYNDKEDAYLMVLQKEKYCEEK